MSLTIEQKITLAQSPDVTTEELEWLANDEDSFIRFWVARHPNCPVSSLEKLDDDEDFWVRSVVASHPNCPRKSSVKHKFEHFVLMMQDETNLWKIWLLISIIMFGLSLYDALIAQFI